MNSFTFNGISSDTFGLYISEKDIYSAPQRDVSLIAVPGRNGDVLIDNGRYCNVDVSYTVTFRGTKEKAAAIRQWLCGSTGYFQLSDSYQPGYFRLASFATKLNIAELLENVGQAQIVFSCKPFRYRNDGQTAVTLTASGRTVTNPEAFSSEPQITVYGSGNVTLTVGNRSYPVTGINGSITLDSELMCAFKGDTLCNSKIGFSEFPLFSPGSNLIQWTGSVTKLVIVPRWRSL